LADSAASRALRVADLGRERWHIEGQLVSFVVRWPTRTVGQLLPFATLPISRRLPYAVGGRVSRELYPAPQSSRDGESFMNARRGRLVLAFPSLPERAWK
jgi:hypothetical protein